jgi:hypothetical protein
VFEGILSAIVNPSIDPQIRAYSSRDAPALERLLQDVWAPHGEHEWESHQPQHDSITLLAFRGERLLAMMTRHERRFHPYATTLGFGIDSGIQRDSRRELEEALFDRISRDLPTNRVMRCQFLETQTREIEFVHAKRFLEMRRTWMPTVPVSSLPTGLFSDSLASVLGRGFSIHRLDALRNDPDFMVRLTEANRDHSLATHGINPPREASLREWQDLAFGEDWLPEASFVAI